MHIFNWYSDQKPGFDEHNGPWRRTLFGAYGGYEGQYLEHTVEGESLSAEIQRKPSAQIPVCRRAVEISRVCNVSTPIASAITFILTEVAQVPDVVDA